MSSFLLLSNLDVGRAFDFDPLRRKPEQIADWLLKEYVKKPGGLFNYDPAIKCLHEMFQGRLSLADARFRCATTGNRLGRPYNVQAIDCVGPYAVENPSTCYRIGYTAVPVGRAHGKTIYVGLKAPLLRVADGKASVVLPGFRKTNRPVGPQVDVACSIALAAFARDDLAEADFEYLDAGETLAGERLLRVYSGRERHIYGPDDVDAILDTYVKGVALALDSGVTVKDANLRGYRVIDPDQPSIFA